MSRLRHLKDGIAYLLRGFFFLARHPRLWGYALLPTIVNLVILGVMLGTFIHYYGDLYTWLSARLGIHHIADAVGFWQHLLSGLLWFVNAVFQVFIVLISLILLLIVSYAVGLIVAGPFNELLSEKVEVAVTGVEPPPFAFKRFLVELLRTIRVETVKAVILIAIPVVLFVLSFIPLVGGPLYVMTTFVFGAWSLGFSYAELPLSRRVVPFAMRKRFALDHRWALIGLGAGFAIPFFSLIFSSPMVVGGTLYYVDRAQSERI